MIKFCNPYHFVSVEETTQEHHLGLVEGVFRENHRDKRHKAFKNYSHAQYYPDTYSGRLICRLTTEGAVFIGADQKRPDSKDVAIANPFELNGMPAIPASSLRGLLSSLMETASNSALRILDDRTLSYRREVEDALSAIGMVECREDEQGQRVYRLRPLNSYFGKIKGK